MTIFNTKSPSIKFAFFLLALLSAVACSGHREAGEMVPFAEQEDVGASEGDAVELGSGGGPPAPSAPDPIAPDPAAPDGSDGGGGAVEHSCEGILDSAGQVCCPTTCGECGGEGCAAREGGGSACCSSAILQSGALCSAEEPPCILNGAEPVDPEPEVGVGVTAVPGVVALVSYSSALPETDGNQGDSSGRCQSAEADFKVNQSGNACILTDINPKEWIEYRVQVAQDGVFDVVMNLGAEVSDQSTSLLVDGELVGSVNSPSEGKHRMLPVTVWRIPLKAGERSIRIRFNGEDMQMNRLEIKESDFASRTRSRFASAANDGRDDTALFQEILGEGGVIDIPAGTYHFKPTGEKNGVRVRLSDASIHVRADANAVFVAKDVDDDLFNFDAGTPSFRGSNSDKKIDISWYGGKIDIRDSYVSTSVPAKSDKDRVGKRATTDGLSIRSGVVIDGKVKTKVKDVQIRGLEVIGSDTNYRDAGGDSGLFVSAADSLDIRWCLFKGARDAAIYVSASHHDPTAGGNFNIEYVDVFGAYDGIASKRGASNVSYSYNRIENVAVGIVVRTINGSMTRNIKINDNRFERVERAIAAEVSTTGEIKGNTVTRLGAAVAGYSTTRNPEKSYQGVSLRGVTGFVVEGNTIDGVASAREPKVGIDIDRFARRDLPTVGSGEVTIGENTYRRLDRNVWDHAR